MQPPGGDEISVSRATAQISAITALARIAGFARWIVLGLAVGTTYLGNTYQTANLIPNILFELAAGGVLSSVLVPTFVEQIKQGRERGVEVATSLTNALLLASIPLVIGGLLAARPIMRAMTVGVEDPAIRAKQIELGAWFLRFFLPQIPLYLLGMVFQGILHAHKKFVISALAPLLSSLTVITTYVVFRLMGPGATLDSVTQPQLFVLAGGTTLGVVVLSFSQLPSVLRLGIRWSPVLRLKDPAVRRAVKAGGWGIAFFAVTEASLLVTLVLANRVEGGVVAFQIANAFFELPNAVIGLPVAISAFPSLSEAFVDSDEPRYARLLSQGWRLAVFLAVPAAVGLFVLAPTLSRALLGFASILNPALVAACLRGLAIGVPAWVLISTLTRAFYARHRTAPPVALNFVSVATYAAVAITMTVTGRLTGGPAMMAIGLGIAAGHWAGLSVGIALLSRRVRAWTVGADLAALGSSAARSAVMGLVVWGVTTLGADLPAILRLLIAVAAGGFSFLILSLRSPELKQVRKLIRP